ncbi:RNA-directed DNA polymerase, eukaryota [Tanacetum coccineum]
MLLDVALKNLKGLVSYFEIYRESGLDNAISEAKQIAETLEIEPEFTIKRAPCRKKQFDEIPNTEREQQSAKEQFRNDYFLVLVDMALVQLNSRFEQMKYFESIFGFMFDASKLAYLDDANLKECCLHLESALTNDGDCDIDGKDLFIELQILQEMLPNGAYDGERPWSSIEIMEFTKKMDMFPNVLLAYKILLTIPVTVASAERSFSKLKILKSYLRSTMSQERLNGLAILSIKSKFLANVDHDKIIDEFASRNARRHRFRDYVPIMLGLCSYNVGWAPDFSNSHDDSLESDDESVDGKSKDVYSKKVSEAEEIPKIIFEVEKPGEIKFYATKENKSEDLEKVHDTSKKEHGSKAGFKEDANTSVCSCHFKRVGTPKPGGSMLKLIEDLIKVGQTIGYKMEGCINDIEEIENSTVSDYFIAIMGKWLPNDKNLLITTVYAPQELSEKRMLWQYLVHVIEGWKGDIIVMGDFNEVRTAEERFGSIFNARGVAAFNSFISTGGLVEVPLGEYSYTWAHKSAAKMSKLDRFLISKYLMRIHPNISSIILDRYLSNHMPILLREISLDYGPTPFCFFHHWFDLDGFDLFVTESWKAINIQEPNAMLKLVKKLKLLKGQIRLWVKDKKDKAQLLKNSLKKKLAAIDSSLDKGDAASDALEDRLNTMNNLTNLERMESLELAQKAKIKWSIEGDENLKKFHGIINKQRNNLAILGIIVDGEWIEDPMTVKYEFLAHFRDRFDTRCKYRLTLDMNFPNKLSTDQMYDLERPFLKEEIKGAVWDCGLNKSSGPDGFTFGFYRKFWSLIEEDVVADVNHFFHNGYCKKGGNYSFIALIPKSPGAKMVKDFRPISLIARAAFGFKEAPRGAFGLENRPEEGAFGFDKAPEGVGVDACNNVYPNCHKSKFKDETLCIQLLTLLEIQMFTDREGHKIGVTRYDGRLALGRLGALCEQAFESEMTVLTYKQQLLINLFADSRRRFKSVEIVDEIIRLDNKWREQATVMNLLRRVDLKNNKFTGGIPSSLPGLRELHYLEMQNNEFEGVIPRFRAERLDGEFCKQFTFGSYTSWQDPSVFAGNMYAVHQLPTLARASRRKAY